VSPTLTEQQEQFRQRLLESTPIQSTELRAALQASVDDLLKTRPTAPPGGFHMSNKQFLILLTCRDEKQQVELLWRFTEEGWQCKALVA
jgi:hypothetical protein